VEALEDELVSVFRSRNFTHDWMLAIDVAYIEVVLRQSLNMRRLPVMVKDPSA
jgi:hypothetical protein